MWGDELDEPVGGGFRKLGTLCKGNALETMAEAIFQHPQTILKLDPLARFVILAVSEGS